MHLVGAGAAGIAVLALGTGALSWWGAGKASVTHTVRDPAATAPAAAPPTPDQKALTAAALASGSLRALAPIGTEFTVTTVETAEDVGVLFGAFRNSTTHAIVPSEPVTVLGTKDGGRWAVVFPGEPTFCSTLQHTPESLLTATEKSYFIGCEVG